jgi:hypothetical protein
LDAEQAIEILKLSMGSGLKRLILFLIVAALLGCTKPTEKKADVIDVKEETTEAPAKASPGEPKSGASTVLLKHGTAAARVVFPEAKDAKSGEWLTLVNVGNEETTHSLPRVPIGDAHATLMLNIPPGFYPVDAQAWLRKQEPYAGGRSGVISFAAGEFVVLMVNEPGMEKPPFGNVPIEVADRLTWGLDAAPNLQKYVGKIADQARAKKNSGN